MCCRVYLLFFLVINTQVQLVLSMATTTVEGKPWRHFHQLDLTRSSMPTFLFPWVLQHKLDPASPLHSLTLTQWRNARVDIHCVVTAVDSVFGGGIWARHRYSWGDVRFGWRPADVFTDLHADELARSGVGDGGVQQPSVRVIDMALFDAMERDESEKEDWQGDDKQDVPTARAAASYQRHGVSRTPTREDDRATGFS